MKLLITGGAGFIGANFLAWEREKYPQDTLICVDKLTYAGNAQNILPLVGRGEVTFFCEDVANKSAMRRLFARVRPDAVVHFAAESHVRPRHRRPRALCAQQRRRHGGAAGTVPRVRLPFPSRLHRRGVRSARQRGGAVSKARRAAPQPVRREPRRRQTF